MFVDWRWLYVVRAFSRIVDKKLPVPEKPWRVSQTISPTESRRPEPGFARREDEEADRSASLVEPHR